MTKLVQGLENHLQVRLLNRTARRVKVTPDGSAYYERAVRLLADLEDIESSVSNAQTNPKEGCGSTSAVHSRACSSFQRLP